MLAQRSGVERFFWYPSYSLTISNEQPTLAMISYAAVTRILGDAKYLDSPYLSEGTFAQEYRTPRGYLVALWSIRTPGDHARMRRPSGKYSVYDMWGNEIAAAHSGDEIWIALSDSPVYLELSAQDGAVVKTIGVQTKQPPLLTPVLPGAKPANQ
jgi:hypothetical protein